MMSGPDFDNVKRFVGVRRRLHGLKAHATVVLLVVAIVWSWTGRLMGQSRERGAPRGFEEFQVVVDQNMFLRDRERRSEPAPRERESEEEEEDRAPAPERPEEWYVLRGLVFEGEEPLAFIENTQEGSTRAYRQGDSLLDGRIGGISLSGVEYEVEDRRVRVGLGEDLRGIRSAAVTAQGAGGASVEDESAEPPRPTGNLSEIELRMRQRRMQEGGGR